MSRGIAIPTQSPGASLGQAQNEALVRFGPQRFALQQLIAQALQTRDLAVHAAAGAERGIQSTITQARGETAKNYGTALATTGDTRSLVDAALAHLGGAASPFAAAIAGERGAATDRLTLGQANALQDLTDRRVQAASGQAFATQHASDQYAKDINNVRQSYRELANEQGAFTQGRVAELKKEAADRQFQYDLAQYTQSQQNQRSRTAARTQRRGQDLSHQDRQAAVNQRHQDAVAKRNAGRIGSNGPKLASQDAHTALWQQIQGALPDARTQKQLGRNYGETANLLTNGRRQTEILDPAHLDPTTQKPIKRPVPGITKRGRLAAIVAADLVYHNGGITQRTMDILHAHGFSTRQLQLKRQPTTGRGQGGPYGTGHMFR